MKKSLIESLRDPVTGQPLALTDTTSPDGDEITAGELVAPDGTRYAIEAGVPHLVRRDQFAEGQKETVDSFSWKWQRAQNYRSATLAHYTQWFLDRYGFRDEATLRRFLGGKQRILDAGTAHGRDAAMYARNSSAQVFGIDVSEGIANAYRDLGRSPQLNFVQADLSKLPFPEGFFDVISCDQVIHHTPDTHASLRHLLTRLAPGGHVLFYVYRRKGPIREFCDDYIRARTVRMSPDECLRVSEAITKFGKALSDLKVTINVPEDIPILGIKAGEQDLQRFIYWNVFKCYWNDTMDWDSNVITNFDWYHPLHAHRHTREEIESWCAEAGLSVEHIDEQESGISVRARNPD